MSEIYYKRAICFCNKKIKKPFICDLFQIKPITDYIDSDIPTNHFPFILEYKVDKNNVIYYSYEDIFETFDNKTKDFLSEISHETNTMNYILKLLTVVSNFIFFTYDINDQAWFINLNGKTEEEISCKYGAKLYFDSNMKDKMHINGFTKIEEEEIEPQKHSEYYTNPDLDNERKNEITFSEMTKKFFEYITELDDVQKKYFDSAVTLINNGCKIRQNMKSISFLAFVSSIEAMTTLEGKINKIEIEFECNSCQSIKTSAYNCKKCGRPIWGISQQIKLYLEKYLSSSEKFKTIINKLYSRRSQIAHTGGLFTSDEFFDWDNPKTREAHNIELIAAMQYSKMSLVNYVLKNINEKRRKNCR
ncbi:HEPN domain-containing protein [Chryseobacterium suipulveris]|uniref:HEPN domain-containing protein n=1 Tax=Chryseobacterium suipulveris TaxID=2929800 RepID=A0ABY4BSE1_9FLAO|nr:HEPN domain-containing protein [Chryseobacterium suipulveris]UOE42123.1 HEPN domain-containing protein [Chryseobacterium suipulveris]